MINAGELKWLIAIEQRAYTVDGLGNKKESGWADFARPRAGKRDVGAKERLNAGQEVATRATVFRLHWLDGVTTDMRVVLEPDGIAEVYAIKGKRELGNRQGLELTCEISEA